MKTDEIVATLAELLEKVAGVDPEDVVPEKAFVEDLGLDSLALVEVVVNAQVKFGVDIPEDDARSLRTVGDFVAYIEKAGR